MSHFDEFSKALSDNFWFWTDPRDLLVWTDTRSLWHLHSVGMEIFNSLNPDSRQALVRTRWELSHGQNTKNKNI